MPLQKAICPRFAKVLPAVDPSPKMETLPVVEMSMRMNLSNVWPITRKFCSTVGRYDTGSVNSGIFDVPDAANEMRPRKLIRYTAVVPFVPCRSASMVHGKLIEMPD